LHRWDRGGEEAARGLTMRRYRVAMVDNSCTAFLSQYVGNGFVEDPDIVTNCPSAGSASGDLNTLSVTFENPQTTLDLLVSVRTEWFDFFAYPRTGGEYAISADLRVDPLVGAAFTAPSPNFLTLVPEPEESLLA